MGVIRHSLQNESIARKRKNSQHLDEANNNGCFYWHLGFRLSEVVAWNSRLDERQFSSPNSDLYRHFRTDAMETCPFRLKEHAVHYCVMQN